MTEITHIFFDNDGILVDTEGLFFEANCQVLSEMGITNYTLNDFQHHTQVSNAGSSGYLKSKGFDDKDIKVFKIKRNQIWKELVLSRDILIKGVKPTLEKLKQLYTLTMVTSTGRSYYEFAHKKYEVLPLFDLILCADDCKVIKPDPEAYLIAMERMNVSASQSIIVEDTPRGIVAGKAAGVKVVAIKNPFCEGLDISNADYILNSIEDLPTLLKNL